MKNFIFKSSEADLHKIFQLLETIQKNSLYSTYRLDALLKKVNEMVTDKVLQNQVDEYFDDSNTVHPEDNKDLD